ncbi:cytochrome c peroxidase [Cytophagaceae bacterium YF14B1]|uniref:Cytochrome c peroxidase n=1 Tax=Xanthocytophaga flava TaxID=3048013 RepID=A0AAE3QP94_9BACT|nr:cytochrome c peroxidase [Xanthocytophaga flavus]MDJ1480973.1 cytochrome c peroxidase [Xanthocytophaga flavus]
MKITIHTLLRLTIFVVSVSILFFSGCNSKSSVDPSKEFSLEVPSNFPAPVFTFSDTPITEEGFELGRLLFYEPRLSSTGAIACGTCHRQTFAFADHGHDVSHGVHDRLGSRNAPAIQNMAFQPEFFWDGGVNHIELIPLNAIQNTQEMDESLANILTKLNNNPTYKQKFKEVFNTDSITSQLVFRAMAQFTGMLISSNSRYDHYVRGENNVQLTDTEKAGLQLFQQKCATCHATDLFTDHSYRNNGLDETPADHGRELITNNVSDRGKFKVPSLRNVERTSPYMHDGRFTTLEEVLNHYTSGVKRSATLDAALISGDAVGIPLTATEQNNLIAFLRTLTDNTFVTDKRFIDPLGTSNQN